MGNLRKSYQNMQEESIASLIFKNFPFIPAAPGEDEEISEFQAMFLKQISTMINGSLYVIDFRKRCFHFVSDHDLFLSGFSTDDVLKMNCDFFSKIVYPNDLQLFIDIHRAVLQYLSTPDCNQQGIDYFAFNTRLQHHGQVLMIYHKMAPLFINGHAGMAVCYLSSSVIRKSGNLGIYWNDRKKYSLYSFKKQQWLQTESPGLTGREKDILKLAKQGNCSNEIAEILCVSGKTIRNTETSLYQKLDVHSMLEAVLFATNHRMIFV